MLRFIVNATEEYKKTGIRIFIHFQFPYYLSDTAEEDAQGVHVDSGLFGKSKRGQLRVGFAVGAEEAVPKLKGAGPEVYNFVTCLGAVVHEVVNTGIAKEAAEVANQKIAVGKRVVDGAVVKNFEAIARQKPEAHFHEQGLGVNNF